jgi:hypothetical protein
MEETTLDRDGNYCRTQAFEYKRKADETTDECTRNFLLLMSEHWLIAAEGFESPTKKLRRGRPRRTGTADPYHPGRAEEDWDKPLIELQDRSRHHLG